MFSLDNVNSKHFIQTLRSICTEADQAILEIYRQPEIPATLKADDSPVTEADRISNDIICYHLAHITPQIPILSEEAQQPNPIGRLQWPQCWLLDPLGWHTRIYRAYWRIHYQFSPNSR